MQAKEEAAVQGEQLGWVAPGANSCPSLPLGEPRSAGQGSSHLLWYQTCMDGEAAPQGRAVSAWAADPRVTRDPRGCPHPAPFHPHRGLCGPALGLEVPQHFLLKPVLGGVAVPYISDVTPGETEAQRLQLGLKILCSVAPSPCSGEDSLCPSSSWGCPTAKAVAGLCAGRRAPSRPRPRCSHPPPAHSDVHPAALPAEHTIVFLLRLIPETPREAFALWQITAEDFQPVLGVLLDGM